MFRLTACNHTSRVVENHEACACSSLIYGSYVISHFPSLLESKCIVKERPQNSSQKRPDNRDP